MTERPPSPSANKDATVSTQIQHSGIGEIVGFAVSIGAVYTADHVFPRQTKAFVRRLAEHLGEWRGTSPEIQKQLARQIVDVTIMNIGGMTNMLAQFSLHRHALKPEDRQPLAYDFGRVISGRLAGTVTAVGALALAEIHAPLAMDRGQQTIAGWLGNTRKSNRFGELVMSNFVQSLGGIAGNVPAQLLYDKLVTPAPKQRS